MTSISQNPNRSDTKLSFIVYAPRYRNTSGGAIAMHKLCAVLNNIGHPSALWPLWKPRSLIASIFRSPRIAIPYLAARLYRGKYSTNNRYNSPLASGDQLDESIVIYPEIVSGNPLGAKRYIRWLMHEPGFHEGRFHYNQGDLYFCYQEAFHKYCDGLIFGGILMIGEALLDIYKNTNDGERTKICYIVRKGRTRPDLPDLTGCWIVDELDHTELARAFNECKICYFYDAYTTYAQYAAVCGCIPVVVPLPGIAKERWVPEEAGRWGVAYGDDDIDHAIATRADLIQYLQETESRNEESAINFVKAVEAHFGKRQSP